MTTAAHPPRFTSIADHALLVDFSVGDTGERNDPAEADANRSVVALDAALAAAPIDGAREVVPALVNLLVDFDPERTDHAAVEACVRSALSTAAGAAPGVATHRIPVCYAEPVAPDLAAVAEACGLSVDAVVGAHLAGDYRVLMYGFAPGYAYLGAVPESIRVPRKPTPVRDVRSGSVIIAGPQCLITTLTMPTGWSIIGASSVRVLTADPHQPFLFEVGDRIEFERIDLATLDQLTAAP